MKENKISAVDSELITLLNEINSLYGYDLTQYTLASVKRRINKVLHNEKIPNLAELKQKVRNDSIFFEFFLQEVMVNYTEMFRDPSFYKILREKVFPILSTFPSIKIWHAGCATGEEVYSTAILLFEEGLLNRSIQYATDINQGELNKAESGIFPAKHMKEFAKNYIKSGGKNNFSDYYTAKKSHVSFAKFLKKNMFFSFHNLVSDQSFNEFNLIICRNVLIYFNHDLQNRVLNLFDTSLSFSGILALGSQETIRFSDISDKYILLEENGKIWKKSRK